MEWYSLCPDKTGRFAIAFTFAIPQQHSENNIPRRFWMCMYASFITYNSYMYNRYYFSGCQSYEGRYVRELRSVY